MDRDRPTSSQYFKPGSLFKRSKETINKINKVDTIVDDDCKDYEEIINNENDKLLNKKPKNLIERIDQIESQQVDFTAIQKNVLACSVKGSNTILVNSNQQGRQLLKHLLVNYVITDSIAPAHYILSENCCALVLSLKYHAINSGYIYEQISGLKNKYQLSLLIVIMDYSIYEPLLKELTIMAIRTNFTLLLAWNDEEAAKHIQNYRINSDKSPDIIMGRNFDDVSKKSINNASQQSLIDALTSINRINRTNAITLLSIFDTFENLLKANTEELSLCHGISMIKAKRLHSIFNRPFIKK